MFQYLFLIIAYILHIFCCRDIVPDKKDRSCFGLGQGFTSDLFRSIMNNKSGTVLFTWEIPHELSPSHTNTQPGGTLNV